MSNLDFTLRRLKELQHQAETALESTVKAVSSLQGAVWQVRSEIEHLEHATQGDAGLAGKREAFASPRQGMGYIAIWLASQGQNNGVSRDQFWPILINLRDKRGNPPEIMKIESSLEEGRGKHVTISLGIYTLMPAGLAAVRLHWDRVTGRTSGVLPPPKSAI